MVGKPGTRAEPAESTIEQGNTIRDSCDLASFNERLEKMCNTLHFMGDDHAVSARLALASRGSLPLKTSSILRALTIGDECE